MRILALADEPNKRLWDNLDKKLLEGVDLILSAGDLPADYLSFLTCFTHAPIVYVRGNHDTKYNIKAPDGCICAEDDIIKVNGVRILGLGGCRRYVPDAEDQYSEREMRSRLRTLKLLLKLRFGGFDILLTHAPARGVGDLDDHAHKGYDCFLRLMRRYNPVLMVHGHIHASYNHTFTKERIYANTRVYNACGMVYIDVDLPRHK